MKKIIILISLLFLTGCFTGCCLSHDYEEISIEEYCDQDGKIIYRCKECNYEKTEKIPETGHKFTERITQEANCESTGMIEKICKKCGKTEQKIISKKDHDYEYTVIKEADFFENGLEIGTCTVCGEETEKETPLLGTNSNPGKITITDLVSEINEDIDNAKDKYNEKWVEITGEVKNAYTVAGMTGYYLYGDRGDAGLRIICWVDGDIYSGSVVGKTFTFIGQVREITTFNATEIGDCRIIEK